MDLPTIEHDIDHPVETVEKAAHAVALEMEDIAEKIKELVFSNQIGKALLAVSERLAALEKQVAEIVAH